MQMRDYQQECIDLIDSLHGGNHLVQMATGLGKTVTFANMVRKLGAPFMQMRDYQQECIDLIDSLHGGNHLVQMATGLGKTVTFANIPRKGRVLLLSHRDELVHQPIKYYDCPVGVEKAGERSDGEEVVSASVQTLSRGDRLEKTFRPGEFDMIITDEAHHALAPSYGKIYAYLKRITPWPRPTARSTPI